MPVSAVLIVGPAWIGDMIMAQALFKTLKQRAPDVAIDVLAPAWSLPVVSRMPEVREGIVAPFAHGEFAFGKRRRLGRELSSRRYGQAIVLPRTFKSALVPWFARIPRRTGFRGEMRYGLINDMRRFDPSVLDQMAKRYVALGLDAGEVPREVPYPALTVSEEKQRAALMALGLSTERPVIAMMPGAERGPAKRWPAGHFAELARSLDAEGYAVWLFGSDKDRPAAGQIEANSNAVNLCGRTSLEQAIDLLAVCRQAISNDSGLLFMASAVGIRVVALYGSTTPDFAPPLTDRATSHYLALSCSPCLKRECPLGHLRCLVDITPRAVLQSVLAAS
jgi:heptosyltransferase-2